MALNTVNISSIDKNQGYTLKQISELLNTSYNTVLKMKKNEAFGKLQTLDGKKFVVPGWKILEYIEKKMGAQI